MALLDPVNSASWPKRHHATLARVADIVNAMAFDPVIVHVGPGAVTRVARPFLAEAADVRPSPVVRAVRNFPRSVDHVLRRVPWLDLVSLELNEFQHLVKRPHRLVVVDWSSRVLAAARRDFPRAECLQVDLLRDEIDVKGDVVIAFSVLPLLSDGRAALARVAAAVREGGLLIVDNRTSRSWPPSQFGFDEAAPQIYRKRNQTASASPTTAPTTTGHGESGPAATSVRG